MMRKNRITNTKTLRRKSERGNILFMVLIAIVLIGTLTAVVSSTGDNNGSGIDQERLALHAGDVQRYASELERGVNYIVQNGLGEEAFRFSIPTNTSAPFLYEELAADTDPRDQMFHPDGGAANYRAAPEGVQTSTGGAWEFYGNTQVPQVGSDRSDLIAVLPNVTLQFCEKINALNGQTDTQPLDGGGDIHNTSERFTTSTGYNDAAPNVLTSASFTKFPPLQACVQSGTDYHFYHVLYPR
jgi:hypothetical protein